MSNDDTEQLLSFGDFPMVHSTSAGGSGVAQLNVNSPSRHHHRGPSNDDFLEIRTESSHPTASNEGGQGAGDATKTHSFLQFEFYQQFFDVDTLVVLDRIASSIVPKRAATNYLKSVIGDAPDLYGPIWIVITLVFSIAISGNIARYMQQAGSSSTHWHYNFHLVSLAATVIIFYVCGVSTGLWATFKWTLKAVDPNFETDTSSYTPSLLSLLCVYGYSLAIYIPVSILWMIPVGVFEAFVFISLLIPLPFQFSFLQWLLVITAATLSGTALVFVLRPAIRNSRLSLILIVGIVAAHFLLACSFMLYFFHVPGGAVSAATTAPIVVQVATAVNINETVIKP